MQLLMLIDAKGLESRRRTGKLLILRLTPRGLRRLRLDTTRSSRSSSKTLSWNAFQCPGGGSGEKRELASHNPHGVSGETVAVYVVAKDPSLTTREFFQFLTHHPRLALFKRPRYFKLAERIPMTATGKKQHFLVKAWAREDLEKGELKR
jgi:hypothetical protein